MGWSIFAGGTRTINIYDRTSLIPANKDYYRELLIRYYNEYRDPKAAIASMLTNINNVTNLNLLKALGFYSEVPLVIRKLTKDKILKYIQIYIDDNASYVNNFTKYDCELHKANKYLIDNYETDSSHNKQLTEQVTVGSTTLNDTFNSPTIIINNNNYFLKDVDNNDAITLSLLDSNYNETSTTYIVYSNLSEYNDRVGVIYDDSKTTIFDVTEQLYYITNDTTLMLVLKTDKTLINKNKSNIVLKNVGISSVELYNNISNESTIQALITYMDKYDGIFKEWINENYTINNIIEIENDGITLKFERIKNSNNMETDNVYFNDTKLDNAVFGNTIPIPLRLFNNLTLKDKFNAIQETLSLITHSKIKKNLKWYQTDTFTTIVGMASIIAIAFSGNPALYTIIYATTNIAMQHISNVYLRALIAIAVIALGDYSQTGSIELSTVQLAQLVNTAVTQYFNIINNIEYSKNKKLQNKEKDIEKQLLQFNSKYIYEPYQQIDDYYNLTQNAIYYNYELIDNSCSISYDMNF